MPQKNNYWVDRIQKQNEANYQRSVAETRKLLGDAYTASAQSIKSDIIKLFDKLDKQDDGSYLASDLYKNNYYYDLLNSINRQLNLLGIQEIKITEGKLLDLYEKTSTTVQNEMNWEVQFDNAAGKVLDNVWTPDKTHYSSRIWKNKAEMADTLEQGLMDAVTRGLSKDKIVDSMLSIVGNDRYKAERIVRTELTHIQNQACLDTYKKAGVEYYEFLAAMDDRTSEECEELNGERFRLDEACTGVNFPPIHPNCRCTIIPVIQVGD